MSTSTRLLNLIKSLIRVGRVDLYGDDAGQMPIQQVSYLGKVGDAFMAWPFGVHGNPGPDTLLLLLAQNGRPEGRLAYPMSPKERPKNTPRDDLIMYNPFTGAEVRFLANGDITITPKAGQDVNVVGATNVNVTASTKVTVTAPANEVVGNLLVTGDVEFTGSLKQTGAGIDLVDHVHDENDAGGPTDGPRAP